MYPVDPAGPDCYRIEIKPCESNISQLCEKCGIRLSNTWSTYPKDMNNPGKLGLIYDRSFFLESVYDLKDC